MIELGLSRITRLLSETPRKWKSIHVAGTNGKGSVCAYAAAILDACNVRTGRFTSPSLISEWDCISIAGKTVDREIFKEAKAAVKKKNIDQHVRASEFEILTATAFQLFNDEAVDAGVIEVGLGGRFDATNVIHEPTVSVITKIGMDHEDLLGKKIEDIAYHKAGIMKHCRPCLIDASNPREVMRVLQDYAKSCSAGPLYVVPQDLSISDSALRRASNPKGLQLHQWINLQLAINSVKFILDASGRSLNSGQLTTALRRVRWPGRLQHIRSFGSLNHSGPILLDGAHNVLAAKVLDRYVTINLRQPDQAVTWVLGFSNTKDAHHIIANLVRPQDNVVAVEFGPVETMPWVSPMKKSLVIRAAENRVNIGKVLLGPDDVASYMSLAAKLANGDPIVITGSLYLCAEILRKREAINSN